METTHRPKRQLVIGDIHGQADLLTKLLAFIEPTADNSNLCFLGDYIDRGPDSRRVVETIMALSEQMPIITLCGNHEKMLLDSFDGDEVQTYNFLRNGGFATLESFEGEEGLRHYEPFFRSLKLWHETEDFIFVHAGLRPGCALEQQNPHDLLWIREDFQTGQPTWDKTVVAGHTPVRGPSVLPGKILIDTGAAYEEKEGLGWLTCAELTPGQVTFHSVSKREQKSHTAKIPPIRLSDYKIVENV